MYLHKYKLKNLKKRCQEKWENEYLTCKNTSASRALMQASFACSPVLCPISKFLGKIFCPLPVLDPLLLHAHAFRQKNLRWPPTPQPSPAFNQQIRKNMNSKRTVLNQFYSIHWWIIWIFAETLTQEDETSPRSVDRSQG